MISLKTHNTRVRIHATPAGLEPLVPAIQRPHTRVLDRAAAGFGPAVKKRTEMELKLFILSFL